MWPRLLVWLGLRAPTPVPSQIVAAVGVSSASKDGRLSQRIEAAMSQAVLDASAEGVTDPDQIRARMLAARAAVKASL